MSFSSGLQFRVIKGQGEKDRIVLLDGEELTLGRGEQGQVGPGEVVFRESSVSRLHASLSWKEDKNCFQLTHRSGTNPTMVNGKSAKKILLEPGDRVQMGLLILVLEEVPARKRVSSSIKDSARDQPLTAGPSFEKPKASSQYDKNRDQANEKPPQEEVMTNSAPSESMEFTRSRLDEALQAAPPRPEDERKNRRGKPVFEWRPPEER